jgi:hypothetical protein
MVRRTIGAWWLGGMAAVGVGGCDLSSCPDLGCANTVRLTGTLPAPADINTIDATYCRRDVCKEVTIELAAATGNDCNATGVCASVSGEVIQFQAFWLPNEPPVGEAYRLRLADHATGDLLLDETRKVTAKRSELDECTQCWNAEEKI